MQNVLLLGAGKIGAAITQMLLGTGDYALTVADSDEETLFTSIPETVSRECADVEDEQVRSRLLADKQIVISALPYYLNVGVAESARAACAHYFDLTEDVETTRRITEIAAGAPSAFVPQCGLAPGFIGITAYALSRHFETLDSVQMRVGALPQYPANALMYNLTWSTDGLINEYCNPCEAIYDGERVESRALDGYEKFSLDGVTYEAFNTSGGLGTLCETLEGKVRNLDYKTVRYPGHRDLAKFLARELRLGERRALFRDVLETAVPITMQDVVLVFVTVSGRREGKFLQESFARKIYPTDLDGKRYSAIQITTAAGVCGMVDLLVAGTLPQSGFVRQEDAKLDDFLANRFGRFYM